MATSNSTVKPATAPADINPSGPPSIASVLAEASNNLPSQAVTSSVVPASQTNAAGTDAITALAAQVAALTQALADMQSQMATMAAIKTPSSVVASRPDLRDDVLYLRMKPFNKSSGHLRTRQFVDELQQVVVGGSGKIGEVPVWYAIDPALEPSLKRYRQNDNDPRSDYVFDIVTAEERARIDQAEESMRMSQAGFGAPRDMAARNARARTEDIVSRRAAQAMQPSSQPSIARGAEQFINDGNSVPSAARALAQSTSPAAALPQNMTGRAAALQNVADAPEPEDLSAEAMVDAEAAAIAEQVQQAAAAVTSNSTARRGSRRSS